MTQGAVLVRLVLHLVLTGLPLVAVMLVTARAGVRQVPVILASGLAGSGAAAMLVFWGFFAAPALGHVLAVALLVSSAVAVVWSLRSGMLGRDLVGQLLTPLGLWAAGSGFLVFLGFLHGGVGDAVVMAGTRFSQQLPSDNVIPGFFAQWFYVHGHHGVPPVFSGGWQASDRPPMQIGYVLSQLPISWDPSGLSYQVLGVMLQQLWIVGLWALMVAARLGRTTRMLVAVTVLISDLTIVNGFFVWPKLLPAAMLLAAAALVITPLWSEVRDSRWGLALVAALLGLAMLGHGASVFGVIPLGVIAVARAFGRWRSLMLGLCVVVVLLAPWSAYQRYGDPPGNRLTNWALAGIDTINGPSTLHAVTTAYRQAGLAGTLRSKGENFETISGGPAMARYVSASVNDLLAGRLADAVLGFRVVGFFYLLPAFGLLLIAPLLMVVGRLRRKPVVEPWSFALRCAGVFGAGTVVWCLIMFGDAVNATVIHQGTYLLPILGFCAAVAGLRATFPRFAIGYLAINAAVMLSLYVPDLTPLPGTAYSPIAAVISGVSLAGFLALALRSRLPVVTTGATATRVHTSTESPAISAIALRIASGDARGSR